MSYDSVVMTLKHKERIKNLLHEIIKELLKRADKHDNSKLVTPEKKIFDEFTPKLKDSTYGSEEYNSFLNQMKEGLKHHYENNSHHPEHYENGIDGMNLIDIIEMFCDWKAASERHENGSIERSIKLNKNRFQVSEQLCNIFTNSINLFKGEK